MSSRRPGETWAATIDPSDRYNEKHVARALGVRMCMCVCVCVSMLCGALFHCFRTGICPRSALRAAGAFSAHGFRVGPVFAAAPAEAKNPEPEKWSGDSGHLVGRISPNQLKPLLNQSTSFRRFPEPIEPFLWSAKAGRPPNGTKKTTAKPIPDHFFPEQEKQTHQHWASRGHARLSGLGGRTTKKQFDTFLPSASLGSKPPSGRQPPRSTFSHGPSWPIAGGLAGSAWPTHASHQRVYKRRPSIHRAIRLLPRGWVWSCRPPTNRGCLGGGGELQRQCVVIGVGLRIWRFRGASSGGPANQWPIGWVRPHTSESVVIPRFHSRSFSKQHTVPQRCPAYFTPIVGQKP